jgi:hypothetical protein
MRVAASLALGLFLAACSSGGPSDGGAVIVDMSELPCAGQTMPQCAPGMTALCLANMWHCEGPGADMSTHD